MRSILNFGELMLSLTGSILNFAFQKSFVTTVSLKNIHSGGRYSLVQSSCKVKKERRMFILLKILDFLLWKTKKETSRSSGIRASISMIREGTTSGEFSANISNVCTASKTLSTICPIPMASLSTSGMPLGNTTTPSRVLLCTRFTPLRMMATMQERIAKKGDHV
jgi:hypothetical protein